MDLFRRLASDPTDKQKPKNKIVIEEKKEVASLSSSKPVPAPVPVKPFTPSNSHCFITGEFCGVKKNKLLVLIRHDDRKCLDRLAAHLDETEAPDSFRPYNTKKLDVHIDLNERDYKRFDFEDMDFIGCVQTFRVVAVFKDKRWQLVIWWDTDYYPTGDAGNTKLEM